MKLIVVKCPKNKKVQVEDRGTLGAVCPENCPMKQSSRCFNKTFRYIKPLPSSVVPDILYSGASGIQQAQHKTEKINITPPASPKVSESTRTETKKEPEIIPMPDIFADNTEVIEYNDPFAVSDGTGAFETQSSSYTEAVTSAPNGLLSKYNDFLTEDTSIFSVVKQRREDEPCFVDGAFEFYERPPVSVRSAGNARAALRYIFNHWYVSRVFKDNGSSFCEEFLYLLKLRGFKNAEEKLTEIINDVTTSVDSKFFKVFYSVVYKNQISGFYWNEGDSPFRNITPMFISTDDFYKKLIASGDPSDFMEALKPCFEELVCFLRAGNGYDRAKEWFKEKIPQFIAEKQRRILHISENGGSLSFVNLGDIRAFVQNMNKAESEEKMRAKIDFLREFEITETYSIIPRKKELALVKNNFKVDDGVYEAVGIFKHTSSRCATAFSYYATLVREYMNTFKPESINVGNARFTMRNFYYELLEVVKDAGAYITVENSEKHEEVKLLHTVKSLFAAGVFEYYESRCETSKLGVLKEAFVERETLDVNTYFLFKEINHEVYVDGRSKPVTEYIESITNGDIDYIAGAMADKIVRAYLDANVERRIMRPVEEKINSLIKKQSSLVEKF